MSDIKIRTGRKYSATVIPNVFIDRYMAGANGLQIKVYLYVLRCLSGSSVDFTISSAADMLDESEKDVVRALNYWEKSGVLELEKKDSEITAISLTDLSQDPVCERLPEVVSAPAVISISEKTGPEKKEYTREDIDKALGDPNIKWLSDIVAVYLERLLTNEDYSLILFMYYDLHFSNELILHLYEVCVSRNKKNCKYIQTVAINWFDEGITTVEDAEQYSAAFDNYFSVINRSWNLGRLPGDKEKKLINKWKSMGFSTDIVKEACDRTLLNAGKPSFSYADKILTSWHEKGYTTLDQVKADTGAGASRSRNGSSLKTAVSKSAAAYNSYQQRSYTDSDMDEIERQLLQRSKLKANREQPNGN